MEVLSRLIIGKEQGDSEKRNIIWNMIGSFLYALASMVLSIAVVQIAGADAGRVQAGKGTPGQEKRRRTTGPARRRCIRNG